MSFSYVSLRLRELVQTVIHNVSDACSQSSWWSKCIHSRRKTPVTNHFHTWNRTRNQHESVVGPPCVTIKIPIFQHLTRSSLVQQLCLLQKFYLNELYTAAMNTAADRSDTVRTHRSSHFNSTRLQKSRDMISELRRSAFDTDLLLPGQSCQDLSNPSSPISPTMNPRRVEALQRDYERLGFQVNATDLNDGQCISSLGSARTDQRFPKGSARSSITSESFLLLHSTKEWFYSCKFFSHATLHWTFSLQFVLENSCKTLQQQCPLVKAAIEVTRILCTLFSIGVERKSLTLFFVASGEKLSSPSFSESSSSAERLVFTFLHRFILLRTSLCSVDPSLQQHLEGDASVRQRFLRGKFRRGKSDDRCASNVSGQFDRSTADLAILGRHLLAQSEQNHRLFAFLSVFTGDHQIHGQHLVFLGHGTTFYIRLFHRTSEYE